MKRETNPTITVAMIESLDPCEEGISNFKRLYPEFNDSLSNLLRLEDIPYSDKTWLAEKVTDTKILNQWAVECAESVLDNYETAYPGDSRVRDCIEVTKKFLAGTATKTELEEARSGAESAESAALSAVWSAVWSAALSAARSAQSAARSAESAVCSAAYSAESAESAARSAVWSAARSAAQDLNLSLLIALMENE